MNSNKRKIPAGEWSTKIDEKSMNKKEWALVILIIIGTVIAWIFLICQIKEMMC